SRSSPPQRCSMHWSSCSLFFPGNRLSSRTAATRASLEACNSAVGYSRILASTFKSCISASLSLQLFRVDLLHGRQLLYHGGGLLAATKHVKFTVAITAVAEAEAAAITLLVSGGVRE